MYAIISVILGIIIAAVLVVFIADGESDYIKICDFDFDSKDSGVSEMAYDSWNKTDGAKFSYSQNGGMDDSGCLVIETKNEDDARYKYTYDEALENTFVFTEVDPEQASKFTLGASAEQVVEGVKAALKTDSNIIIVLGEAGFKFESAILDYCNGLS